MIDLIAYANPGLYLRIPLEVFRLNFTENLKIAETCVRHGKRLIQFSTCEVYGRTAASLSNARVADPEDPIHATFTEDDSEYILGPVLEAPMDLLLRQAVAGARAARLRTGEGLQLHDHPAIQLHRAEDRLSAAEAGRIPRVFSFFMEALLNGTADETGEWRGEPALLHVYRRCHRVHLPDRREPRRRVRPADFQHRLAATTRSPSGRWPRRCATSTRGKFRDRPCRLPEIVSVHGRRVLRRRLRRFRPPHSRYRQGAHACWVGNRVELHEALEATMRYYVAESRKNVVPSAAGDD